MHYTQYSQLKQAGTITLSYVDGDTFGITTKHFDSNTGAETSPTYETATVSDLQAQVSNLQAQIDELNSVIADAQALTPPLTHE